MVLSSAMPEVRQRRRHDWHPPVSPAAAVKPDGVRQRRVRAHKKARSDPAGSMLCLYEAPTTAASDVARRNLVAYAGRKKKKGADLLQAAICRVGAQTRGVWGGARVKNRGDSEETHQAPRMVRGCVRWSARRRR